MFTEGEMSLTAARITGNIWQDFLLIVWLRWKKWHVVNWIQNALVLCLLHSNRISLHCQTVLSCTEVKPTLVLIARSLCCSQIQSPSIRNVDGADSLSPLLIKHSRLLAHYSLRRCRQTCAQITRPSFMLIVYSKIRRWRTGHKHNAGKLRDSLMRRAHHTTRTLNDAG